MHCAVPQRSGDKPVLSFTLKPFRLWFRMNSPLPFFANPQTRNYNLSLRLLHVCAHVQMAERGARLELQLRTFRLLTTGLVADKRARVERYLNGRSVVTDFSPAKTAARFSGACASSAACGCMHAHCFLQADSPRVRTRAARG